MRPLIERWERHIVAAGSDLEPEVSAEELQTFAGRVSNPEDVRSFLEKWNTEGVDVEEGLEEGGDDDDDDVEVVVSDDEEEDDDDDDEDEEMKDFIVGDDEEEEVMMSIRKYKSRPF